jgi:hypothetical protein
MPSPGIEPGPRPSQGRVRIRHTPRTRFRADRQSPARESDPALRLRRPPCLRHTRGEDRCRPARDERTGTMPSPGVEPGLRPSEGRVRFRHTPRAGDEISHDQQGRKDSNPVREFWRLAALPGAHPYSEVEGIRRELNPAPRESQSRVLPLHHEHHHVRPEASRKPRDRIASLPCLPGRDRDT